MAGMWPGTLTDFRVISKLPLEPNRRALEPAQLNTEISNLQRHQNSLQDILARAWVETSVAFRCEGGTPWADSQLKTEIQPSNSELHQS